MEQAEAHLKRLEDTKNTTVRDLGHRLDKLEKAGSGNGVDNFAELKRQIDESTKKINDDRSSRTVAAAAAASSSQGAAPAYMDNTVVLGGFGSDPPPPPKGV